MAESAEIRNRRAQDALRAMGVDPGPLRGADYRYRKAQGIARGLSIGQAVGKPRVGERFVRKNEVRQAKPRLRAQPSRALGQRKVTDVAGPGGKSLGRIVQSSDPRFIAQQLRKAAKAGEKVAVRVTARGRGGTRTHSLSGTTEQRVRMADRIAAGTASQGDPDNADGVELATKPQLTFSKSAGVFDQGQGFDPAALLAFLDTYDDMDDGWADMWDWESYP
jgi:hypothetical protein